MTSWREPRSCSGAFLPLGSRFCYSQRAAALSSGGMRVGQGLHLGSLNSNGHGGWSTASERDIHDVAAVLIREHAESAANAASEWVALMCVRGDRDGHAVWRRILWTVEDIQHRSMRGDDTACEEGCELNVPRLYSGIDDALECIIRQALSAARDKGECDLGQIAEAIRAVQEARPDLTVPDALSAVEMARRQ